MDCYVHLCGHCYLLQSHLRNAFNVLSVQAYACSLVKLAVVECLCNTTACHAEGCTTLTAEDYSNWAEVAEP